MLGRSKTVGFRLFDISSATELYIASEVVHSGLFIAYHTLTISHMYYTYCSKGNNFCTEIHLSSCTKRCTHV